MAVSPRVKIALNQKFKKVKETPAGFEFYVSVHDFIRFIESNSSFDVFLREKGKRSGEIPPKYFFLKQVYQGIEDIDGESTGDLGHDRYVAIRELSLIREKDLSENNSFWKRRELFRKLTGEVYATLHAHIST